MFHRILAYAEHLNPPTVSEASKVGRTDYYIVSSINSLDYPECPILDTLGSSRKVGPIRSWPTIAYFPGRRAHASQFCPNRKDRIRVDSNDWIPTGRTRNHPLLRIISPYVMVYGVRALIDNPYQSIHILA